MNRAALRSQFKALLNRNDCTNTLADLFIDQALSRIQRTLRVPSMERASSISFTQALPSSFIVPNDFLEFIDLYYQNDSLSVKLVQLPMGRFIQQVNNHIGVPKFYCRVGPEVKVLPMPPADVTLTLLYYAEVTDFTTDTSSNFISDNIPELLIYGALSFAGDYFVDDRKSSFEDVYQRTYGEIQEQARMLEFSGGEMRVQPTYGLDQDY